MMGLVPLKEVARELPIPLSPPGEGTARRQPARDQEVASPDTQSASTLILDFQPLEL